jgi:hypothetical protein
MKDRNAFSDNQIRKADPAEALHQRNHVGIPAGSFPGLVEAPVPIKGLPAGEARGLIEAPIFFSKPKPKVKVCAGINKKGFPCGAHPVKGAGYCVGHLKSEQGRNQE